MKILVTIASLVLLTAPPAFSEEPSLSDKHVDVTIQHIKEHGPNHETSTYVGGPAHWKRRKELVALAAPHLHGKNPDKVAGALEVLYRLRTHRPMGGLTGGPDDFEKNNADFFSELDQLVHGQLEHFHAMKSDRVYKSLALYLATEPTIEGRRHLLRIIESPFAKNAKEQALICLSWQREPKDMSTLLPYMLEDSSASRSLPYHFRNGYGKASIPFLVKALTEAKRSTTQFAAAKELVHLRVPDGFQYLQTKMLAAPKPEDRRNPPREKIRGFAWDYLQLPRDVTSPEEVAEHIAKSRLISVKNHWK